MVHLLKCPCGLAYTCKTKQDLELEFLNIREISETKMTNVLWPGTSTQWALKWYILLKRVVMGTDLYYRQAHWTHTLQTESLIFLHDVFQIRTVMPPYSI